MKDWKKRWKSELDQVVPPLSEKVKNQPIATQSEQTTVEEKPKKNFLWLKRLMPVCAALIVTLVAVMTGILYPFGGEGGSVGKTAIMSVEINPKATFTVNDDGKVTSVVAVNSDADVVLSSEQTMDAMIGKDIAVAVTKFVTVATELGYINLNEEDAVRISSCGEWKDEWLANAKNSVTTYFKDNKIKTVVIEEKVDFTEFCSRVNFTEFDDLDEVGKWLEKAKPLTIERDFDEKEQSDLQDAYLSSVFNGIIKEEITDLVGDFSEDIKELSDINEQIEQECNGMNYWLAKVLTIHPTPRQKELFDEMQDELDEFYEEYAVAIGSAEELALRLEKSEEFAGIVEDTISSIFDGIIGDLMSVFESIALQFGIDVSRFEEFTEIPTSLDELLNKSKHALEMQRNNREKDNKAELEKEREEFDYDELENNIKDKHGSLNDFWQSQAKLH